MKELNLVEILKDCQKGTKLYSTIYGEVTFEKVDYSKIEDYPIYFYKDVFLESVTKEGLHLVEYDGECTLFPSKDNHDWSTFKAPKPKWNPDTLQPFDKVLGIRHGYEQWEGDFYLYKEDKYYVGIGGIAFDKMIPYNEETKHLLGTEEVEPDYYRL